MTKITVIVGSLREQSFNRMLAKNLERLAPAGVEFHYASIQLPIFSEDMERNMPAEAQALKDEIESADGILFVTPEYNRGVPGGLKNAIDWASRPYGTNSFKGKPVGIVGASISKVGTAVAQADLRHITAYLEMRPMGQPEIYFGPAYELFDDKGMVVAESESLLRDYMQAFVAWVAKEK